MKHSVNGKSFDEIFGQRGTKVQINEQKIGSILLIETPYGYNWVVLFGGLTDKYGFDMFTPIGLASDDSFYCEDEEQGLNNEDIVCIYEASQDQIDLLNSYK